MKNKKIKPPVHLSPEAKKLWRSIVSNYEIDEPAAVILQTLLDAMDRKEQARAAHAADGAVQVDRFGQKKPHPSVAIERDSAMTVTRCFRTLGMDLEARGENSRKF